MIAVAETHANMYFHIHVVTGKKALSNLDQTHVCRHINEVPVARRDGAATQIHLLSPERAHSTVNLSPPSPSRLLVQKTLNFEEQGGREGGRG